MDRAIRIDELIHQIEDLDYDSKLNLLERLVSLLKQNKEVSKTRLTELNGLGSEIWKGVDIETYLSSERQWE